MPLLPPAAVSGMWVGRTCPPPSVVGVAVLNDAAATIFTTIPVTNKSRGESSLVFEFFSTSFSLIFLTYHPDLSSANMMPHVHFLMDNTAS